MRTTLIINDELFAAAKQRAAEQQSSLSAVLNDALRLALRPGAGTADVPPFQIPRYRGQGATVDTTPDQLDDLVEFDELTSLEP